MTRVIADLVNYLTSEDDHPQSFIKIGFPQAVTSPGYCDKRLKDFRLKN